MAWIQGDDPGTDWDKVYRDKDPRLTEIHRGIGLYPDHDLHEHMNDPSVPVAGRAHAVLGEVGAQMAERGGHGIGMSWTDWDRHAEHAAKSGGLNGAVGQSGLSQNRSALPGHRQGNPHMPVVLHAEWPGKEHLETDPQVLKHNVVTPYEHGTEGEVPLRKGAPVRLTGLSWSADDREATPWVHHTFERPVHYDGSGFDHRTAALLGHFEKTGVTHEELDQHLENWFHPQQLEASTVKHPKSGYQVEVGLERRLARPPEGQDEGPAEFNVTDYGPAEKRHMFGKPAGREPVQHVYRGVSTDELKQAHERGYIKSDQRGTIADWEGTNAAADPRSAVSYLPRGGTGHVLKIRVHPDDQWFTWKHDSYLRTRNPVPMSRVEAISPPITKDDKYGAIKHVGEHDEGQRTALLGHFEGKNSEGGEMMDLSQHFPRSTVRDTGREFLDSLLDIVGKPDASLPDIPTIRRGRDMPKEQQTHEDLMKQVASPPPGSKGESPYFPAGPRGTMERMKSHWDNIHYPGAVEYPEEKKAEVRATVRGAWAGAGAPLACRHSGCPPWECRDHRKQQRMSSATGGELLGHFEAADADYHMTHRPGSEEYGAPFHDVEGMMQGYHDRKPSLYDNHARAGEHWVSHESDEQLRRARGNPEADVNIYRALPREHREINSGDWVSSSANYARQHAESNLHTMPWAVIKSTVKAKHLHTEGDMNEWGYHGPDISGAKVHVHGGPRRKEAAVTHPADGDGLTWDEIGARHPGLYGTPGVHGPEARHSDGEGIGDAAGHFAYDRPGHSHDAGEDEGHPDSTGLLFHPRTVDPSQIDYGRHEEDEGDGSDPRVHKARQGYQDDPEKVPPLVLVHRHGVYHVADGHHRADAADSEGKPVRAYVAQSPYPSRPFSDGRKGAHAGGADHVMEATGESYPGFPREEETGRGRETFGKVLRKRYGQEPQGPDERGRVYHEITHRDESGQPTGWHVRDYGVGKPDLSVGHVAAPGRDFHFIERGADPASALDRWHSESPMRPGAERVDKGIAAWREAHDHMHRQAVTAAYDDEPPEYEDAHDRNPTLHPDAECPHCGEPAFGDKGAEAVRFDLGNGKSTPSRTARCNNCGEMYPAHQSGDQARADAELARMNHADHQQGDKAGGELFRHFTEHPTHPVAGWGSAEEAAHQQRRDEHQFKGPGGVTMRQDNPMARQMREHRFNRILHDPAASRPVELPAGQDVRHLSSKEAAAEGKVIAWDDRYPVLEHPDGGEPTRYWGTGLKQVRHPADTPGPLYHGSSREFEPGDHIEAGHPGNFVSRMKHVYMTEQAEGSDAYKGARGYGRHVYEVEPTGPFGHRRDAQGPEWATENPVRVVRRVPDPRDQAKEASVRPERIAMTGSVDPVIAAAEDLGSAVPDDTADVLRAAHRFPRVMASLADGLFSVSAKLDELPIDPVVADEIRYMAQRARGVSEDAARLAGHLPTEAPWKELPSSPNL